MRVLVVEDSAIERMALRAMVEHLGHACDDAHDGAEAWARLRQFQYDVVLTDWMMPAMSGLELCGRIRALDDRPYVFTVVSTASDDRARGLQAVRTGADLFITKPIDLIGLEMCLITAARVVSVQRQLAQQNAQLRTHNSELVEDARTDHLTGLANRRRLDDDLQRLSGMVARYDMNACIAMCDVDRFKLFNDRFGHLAGDQVLARIGSILRATSRDSDTVYRFGGEEMLVLLPGQTPVSASSAVERLRLAVEAAAIPHPDNIPHGVVTISAGVAGVHAGSRVDANGLLALADDAMYEAKRTGRNRVVVDSGSLHRLGDTVAGQSLPESVAL